MNAVIILALIILIILVVSYNSAMRRQLNYLSDEISKIKGLLKNYETSTIQDFRKEIKKQEQAPETKEVQLKTAEIGTASKPEPKQERTKPSEKIAEPAISQTETKKENIYQSLERKKPKDLEKFIGEHLSKIAIVILVLGIAYFVKYAIDKDWINEYGRSAIGLVAGGILIGIAHRLRNSYKTFSSILTGGGFAVLYITIAIAFHQYHIFSQSIAFVLMIIITIFSVLLSLIYDKRELAVFSQMGGYAAPFLVSTGEGNYIVLFSYMLILNGGLLVLAYYKGWHILNLIAYIFTVVLFSGWLINMFRSSSSVPYVGAVIYATVFYVIFFLVNILNNIKERKPFNATEIAMILSNNLFYFISGIAILKGYHNGLFRGTFTVLIGVYNFAWVLYLFRKKQVDKNLLYLLIGLVMSFISLAIPIQLNGHSITLFWTAEFVVLLWLWLKSGIQILKVGHMAILVLILISLCLDWFKLYFGNQVLLTVIINKAFITGVVVLAGLAISLTLVRKEIEIEFIRYFIDLRSYRIIITALLFILAYLVCFLELSYQMNHFYSITSFKQTVYALFNYSFLASAMFIARSKNWHRVLKSLSYGGLIGLLVYLLFYHFQFVHMRQGYLYGNYISLGNYFFHYLVYVPLILITYYTRMYLSEKESLKKLAFWFITFFVVFATSAELDNIMLIKESATYQTTEGILRMSHKIGFPILWAILAFLLMWRGMSNRKRDLRIISLSLLALIILKLFIFDVWSMNQGGRVISFVFLGIVLLIVSFMYQKLKLLFKENENEELTH